MIQPVILFTILIIIAGYSVPVLAETTEQIVPFKVSYIQNLQNETWIAHGSDGYNVSTVITHSTIDFEKAMEPYRYIHLKEGYRLDGFFLDEGMGSFSVPFVVPEDVPYVVTYTNQTPEGEVDPPFIRFFAAEKTGRILRISKPDEEGRDVIALPEHADRQFMKYMEGDDTPESYMDASVFQRELEALDAGWHARIGWPIQDIISYDGTPSVMLNETHAVVKITTTEDYCGTFTTYQYIDTYTRPDLTPDTEIITISSGEGEGICY